MIDTHAHLASESLHSSVEHYLDLAKQAGVRGILSVGTTAQDSAVCIELAQTYQLVRAAVGIHPNYCHLATPEDWSTIERLAHASHVVAIGETGLDRYWDDCPWETQLDYLSRHICLARKMNLPIVVHTRDCVDEAVRWLTEQFQEAPFQAVMHSFTGGQQAAEQCVEIGFYISFAGMITFKNAEAIRASAKTIPLERLLVETDSPYLTPHPYRGKRPNHPALIRHTLECLAEIRGLTADELADVVYQNSKRLFSKWEAVAT